MLYSKTPSPPLGGRTFTAAPNIAVNVAMTAGLFSLPLVPQPAMRIYAPYDRTSGRAVVKRLTALLVVGAVVKMAHWHYRDVVIPEAESTPKANVPHAGGFEVVGRGSSVPFGRGGYMNGNGNGVDIIIGKGFSDIDTLNNESMQLISPKFGPEFLEMGRPVGVSGHSRQGVAKINFSSIIAQEWCIEVDSVDGSSGPSRGSGLDISKEQSILPNFAEIVTRGQSTAESLERSSAGVVGDNVHGKFMSATLVNKVPTIWFSGAYISVLVIFASLATFLGLLLHTPRRVVERPTVSATWLRADPPLGSKRIILGEVWFSKRTMDTVDTLIANGCQFPPPVTEAFKFRARPGYEVLLYIMESLAVASMWMSIKILGEKVSLRALENSFVEYKVADHVMRYLRYLLYPKAAVDVSSKCRRQRMGKTGRRRGRHRLDRELYGTGVRKGYRRSNFKIVAPALSLCTLVLYFWEDLVGKGGGAVSALV